MNVSGRRMGAGRAGRLSPISVNTWIIGINVAVFLIQTFVISGAPRPKAFYGEGFESGISDAAWARRQVVTDRTFQSPDGVFFHPIIDPQYGTVIGSWRFVTHMDWLQWAGHFSTGRVFTQAEIWRFITFQFLHAGSVHLMLNMLGLWFFGPIVEEHLGRRKYAAFYLMCGAAGAMMYLLLNLGGYLVRARVPGLLFNDPYTPLVGASAGVFGVLMACAFIAPRAMVQLLFPPIPMRMRTLAYGYVVISLLSLMAGSPNAGGEAAHIGGAIAGFWLIRRSHVLRDVTEFFAFGEGGGGARSSARSSAGVRRPNDEDTIDAILDKITRSGLGSLTERERDILKRRSS